MCYGHILSEKLILSVHLIRQAAYAIWIKAWARCPDAEARDLVFTGLLRSLHT